MKILESAAGSPLAEALGWGLLHFLWQGALIAAAAAIAMKIAQSARTRYAIACSALLSMPAVFAVTAWLSIPRMATRSMAPLVQAPGDAAPAAGVAASPSFHDFASYVKWAAPVWLAGVVFVLLYRFAAWIVAMRLRRRGTCAAPDEWMERAQALAARIGVSRPVILMQSAMAEVPMMLGYLRPVILVPLGMLAGLPADQVESVLLHELAHIRRADYLVNMLQSAVEALLFYHPAVWWISKVIRNERENCCDDMVLAVQADAQVYATALLTIEQHRWRAPQPAVAANDGDLLRRIRRVLDRGDARGPSLPVIPVAILLFAAAIVFAQSAPDRIDLHFKVPTPQAPAVAVQAAEQPSEMPKMYRNWLNEDVVYIITAAEKKAFQALSTDQEREKFIEQFWERRDPTPGTPENEFREEHYRRIAFAGRFQSSTIPGWKTDRGRIYITYGPPDELESHKNGSDTKPYPFEQWRYKLIDGVGTNVIIEFDDKEKSGDFRMTMDPNPQAGVPVPSAAANQEADRQLSANVNSAGGVTVSLLNPGDYEFAGAWVTNSSGFPVVWTNSTTVGGSMKGFRFISTPGSYVISGIVKELQTGETHKETVSIEVK